MIAAKLGDEWAEEVTGVVAKHRLDDPRPSHRTPERFSWRPSGNSNMVIGAFSASVAIAGAAAALGVHLLVGEGPPASTVHSPEVDMRFAHEPRSFTAQGTIIAINAQSLTAQSPGAAAQTYRITPSTTAITTQGDQSAALDEVFAVHDRVAIVATVRDGVVEATAVADLAVSNLGGPPMDFVDTAPQDPNMP